jgi:hypothetical protein
MRPPQGVSPWYGAAVVTAHDAQCPARRSGRPTSGSRRQQSGDREAGVAAGPSRRQDLRDVRAFAWSPELDASTGAGPLAERDRASRSTGPRPWPAAGSTRGRSTTRCCPSTANTGGALAGPTRPFRRSPRRIPVRPPARRCPGETVGVGRPSGRASWSGRCARPPATTLERGASRGASRHQRASRSADIPGAGPSIQGDCFAVRSHSGCLRADRPAQPGKAAGACR